MVVISEEIKTKLKKPLGRLHRGTDFLELIKNRRILSVGDQTTLVLLEKGIKPHLAVFDFRIMRKKIPESARKKLLSSFDNIKKYKNKPGTVSGYLLKDAKKIIENGGAVLIDGEEDLATLAFILGAEKNDIILYGQPGQGIVEVRISPELKNIIRRMLSSTS